MLSPPGPGLDLPSDRIDSRAFDSAPVFAQPGLGAGDQPPPFGGIDRQLRRTEPLTAAGLDFNEDQRAPVANDQIEFDATRTDVACDDAVPFRLEVARGSFLALGA